MFSSQTHTQSVKPWEWRGCHCHKHAAQPPPAALALTSTLSPPLPSGQTSWWIAVAIHHWKSACTIILNRKPSNACTLEHLLCKIRVMMVLRVPQTLMQTAEFSIKLEGISTTISTINTTITTISTTIPNITITTMP